MEPKKISAIICTYNRARYLQKAIESLRQQSIPSAWYEILVVDNNSTDETKQVVADCQKTLANLRSVFEPTQGLSSARNTGLAHAHTPFVAFLDDDAMAAEQWIEGILAAFEVNPRIGVVGGNIEVIWEAERPAWLEDGLLKYLGRLDLGAEARYLEPGEFFNGGNFALTKECLQHHRFNPQLGMKGQIIACNEEIELQKQLREKGQLFYYDPRIKVGHHARPQALTLTWYRKRLFAQARTNVLSKQQAIPRLQLIERSLWHVKQAVRHYLAYRAQQQGMAYLRCYKELGAAKGYAELFLSKMIKRV